MRLGRSTDKHLVIKNMMRSIGISCAIFPAFIDRRVKPLPTPLTFKLEYRTPD